MSDLSTYRISRLASILGISPQTLRNYEDLGLISSHRSDNNYRTYHSFDLTYLLYISLLRNLDLSLSDIDRIIHGAPGELQDILNRHQLDLQEQIQDLTWKLAELRRKTSELNGLSPDNGISVSIRPAYRGYLFRNNDDLLDDDDLNTGILHQLIARMPTARQLIRITRTAYGEKTFDYAVGMAIREDAAPDLPDSSDRLIRFPASVCVCFTHRFVYHETNTDAHDDDRRNMENAFRQSHVTDYLQDRGLSVRGDIMALDLHHRYRDSTAEHYWRFFLPVILL